MKSLAEVSKRIGSNAMQLLDFRLAELRQLLEILDSSSGKCTFACSYSYETSLERVLTLIARFCDQFPLARFQVGHVTSPSTL
jgi:hypothetical protein